MNTDAREMIERLISLDEDIHRVAYERGRQRPLVKEARELFVSPRTCTVPCEPLTHSIASQQIGGMSDEELGLLLAQLQPRRFFRITARSSDLGNAHVALVGGRTPFLPTEPRTRWDVAPLDGVLKVVAIWSLCPQCFGTGVRNGGSCDYQDLLGNPCESGFVFQGGIRLDLGEALETVRFDPPPEHERYHPVYYA